MWQHRSLPITARKKVKRENGSINMQTLENERLSQTELFDSLRTQGIVHLGQVRAAFLERSGKVSVIQAKPTRPGLCILPNETQALKNDNLQGVESYYCCSNCGKLFEWTTDQRACDRCGNAMRVQPISD